MVRLLRLSHDAVKVVFFILLWIRVRDRNTPITLPKASNRALNFLPATFSRQKSRFQPGMGRRWDKGEGVVRQTTGIFPYVPLLRR
jgi:hypothetical protein